MAENSDITFKYMSEADILVSLDRLTRFKNPEIKYRRVFYDVILKHLKFPSLSKHKLNEMHASEIVQIVEKIWNESVLKLYKFSENKFSPKDVDNLYYSVTDEYTLTLMNADLNIASVIENADISSYIESKNLNFIKILSENFENVSLNKHKVTELRKIFHTLFPVSKLILTEGITEETVLPAFAKIIDYDFDDNGVYVLSTGGKSKVLSLYAELKYILSIPVFVLLDNDAEPVYKDVISVLRKTDRAYLIKSGEFEDILPKHLIKKAFDYMNYDVKPAAFDELSSENGTCHALEQLWKSRGLGEFRKVHLAKAVREKISDKNDLSDEILEILKLICEL